MTKFLLRFLSFLFLIPVFRFIGRTFRAAAPAVGGQSKKPPVPKLPELDPGKTQEIRDEMIIHDTGSLEIELEGLAEDHDMVRNMQILGDSSLVELYPQPNTAIIRETIREIDFYIEQDLLTDARILLDDLAKRAPNHELLKDRRHHLKSVAQTNRPGVIPLEDQPTRIVDYTELAANRAAAK